MKKILLFSDTHGFLDDKILKYVSQADEVWHAGDIGDLSVTDTLKKLKPVRVVYGNIDGAQARMEFPLDLRFECEGVDVFMTHIAGSPGKFQSRVKDILKMNPPKILICGHSHILKVQFDKTFQVLYVNPGAAGIHGFHQVRTMLRFQLDKGKIEQMEVIEFPRKLS
ncbi:MAG: metallophosphoesterase family protein [Flavobacterium sp.]